MKAGDFLNRIKILREELGYSQQTLADKMKLAKSSIASYESEKRKPSLDVLKKFSEIFNCSIDYLLCKTDIKNMDTPYADDPDIAFYEGYKDLSEEDKDILLTLYRKLKENNKKN